MRPSALFAIGLAVGIAAPARAEPVGGWIRLVEHASRTAAMGNPTWRTPATARLEAQVALAMFEAANAVDRRYETYLSVAPEPGASSEAAVAAAAHAVLSALIPAQRQTFDDALTVALAQVPDGPAEQRGVALGQRTAAAAMRRAALPDGTPVEAYRPRAAAGEYIHPSLPSIRDFDIAMPPFFLSRPSELRPAGPPARTSMRYATELDEVRRLGARTSTARRPDQTLTARMILGIEYGPIIAAVARQPGRSLVQNARLYALTYMTAEDAWIAVVDAKMHFRNWRPITAIRNADQDGNDRTERDAGWEPLLPTPAHPDYVCGHCGNAASIAGILEAETGPAPTDGIRITGAGSPGIEMTVASWDDFVREVSLSRIHAGAHTRAANEAAEAIGREVARRALAGHLRPIRR